jgi:hypothetical protein
VLAQDHTSSTVPPGESLVAASCVDSPGDARRIPSGPAQ